MPGSQRSGSVWPRRRRSTPGVIREMDRRGLAATPLGAAESEGAGALRRTRHWPRCHRRGRPGRPGLSALPPRGPRSARPGKASERRRRALALRSSSGAGGCRRLAPLSPQRVDAEAARWVAAARRRTRVAQSGHQPPDWRYRPASGCSRRRNGRCRRRWCRAADQRVADVLASRAGRSRRPRRRDCRAGLAGTCSRRGRPAVGEEVHAGVRGQGQDRFAGVGVLAHEVDRPLLGRGAASSAT